MRGLSCGVDSPHTLLSLFLPCSRQVFRSRIGSWRKGLKGRAEFFFVDAPFPAEPADAAAVAESGGDAGGAPVRVLLPLTACPPAAACLLGQLRGG